MIPDIRKANAADVASITEIYNEAILNTTATFDIEQKTVSSQRKWFKAHSHRNPIFVAVIDNNVIGWASLSEYSSRCAYADTAEFSLYVKESFRNQGIGKTLMQTILDEGHKVGLHTVISRIADIHVVPAGIHFDQPVIVVTVVVGGFVAGDT